jgi:hypothetical protein
MIEYLRIRNSSPATRGSGLGFPAQAATELAFG